MTTTSTTTLPNATTIEGVGSSCHYCSSLFFTIAVCDYYLALGENFKEVTSTLQLQVVVCKQEKSIVVVDNGLEPQPQPPPQRLEFVYKAPSRLLNLDTLTTTDLNLAPNTPVSLYIEQIACKLQYHQLATVTHSLLNLQILTSTVHHTYFSTDNSRNKVRTHSINLSQGQFHPKQPNKQKVASIKGLNQDPVETLRLSHL